MKRYWDWAHEIEFTYWPMWMKVLTIVAIVLMSFIGCIDGINF